MIFRNKAFTGRSYDCTNVVIAQADQMPSDGMEWEPITEEQFAVAVHLTAKSPMQHLYTQAGVRYYGWL